VLSVVIPVFNEESNIDLLYKRLVAAVSDLGEVEYIFINDGSQDETLAKVKALRETDPAVKYASFSRNFGHQVAVTAGLDLARGEAVTIIDADLQDPPEVIPELYRKFQMSRRAVEVFNRLRERHRYVRGMVSWLGFQQTGVSYVRDPRHSGVTKYSYGKMFKLALDGFTSFSNLPLQFAGHLGFWISGGSLIYILYILAMKLFTDKPVIGWASTMTAIIFFGGIQMMTLGVIGEYVGRISDEVKQRPIYIIAEQGGVSE
jgi:dolichol-phosphate mannosyltransferase